MDLDAADEQIDFPILYASARNGWASTEQGVEGTDLVPLFEAIVEHVPAPGRDESGPLQALVTNLDSSPYHGRLAVCRVERGVLRDGQALAHLTRDGRGAAGARSPRSTSPRGSTGSRRRRQQRARWPSSPASPR